MLCRDEVDRDPFDLRFEPLRGDDGTHTDRVWETLAIIDFHSNLLQSGIYVSSGRTDAGPGLGRCRPHCRTAFFLSVIDSADETSRRRPGGSADALGR
jgi:hypothetical protein